MFLTGWTEYCKQAFFFFFFLYRSLLSEMLDLFLSCSPMSCKKCIDMLL